MKKIILLLLLSSFAFGQVIDVTEYNRSGGKEFYFYAASIDSGIAYSDYFRLDEVDGNSFTTYPLEYVYEADSLAGGDGIFKIEIQGAWENNDPAVIDTVVAADTALTATTDQDSGNIDLNNERRPKYRLKVTTSTASGITYRLKMSMYAYKED